MFKNPWLLSLQGSDAGLKTGLVPPVSGQGIGGGQGHLANPWVYYPKVFPEVSLREMPQARAASLGLGAALQQWNTSQD